MVAQIDTTQNKAQAKPDKVINTPTVTVSKGIIQVFTSPVRTFYTDVVAQSLRTAVQGTSVLVVQFFQGGIRQGVNHPHQLGQNLTWLRCDLSRNIDECKPQLTDVEIKAVLDLWQYSKMAIATGSYKLFVLDEINLAIEFSLLSIADVIATLQMRPSQVDIMLTGANMLPELVESADQVSRRRH